MRNLSDFRFEPSSLTLKVSSLVKTAFSDTFREHSLPGDRLEDGTNHTLYFFEEVKSSSKVVRGSSFFRIRWTTDSSPFVRRSWKNEAPLIFYLLGWWTKIPLLSLLPSSLPTNFHQVISAFPTSKIVPKIEIHSLNRARQGEAKAGVMESLSSGFSCRNSRFYVGMTEIGVD